MHLRGSDWTAAVLFSSLPDTCWFLITTFSMPLDESFSTGIAIWFAEDCTQQGDLDV
jgi:hypothetical protein